MQHKKLLLCILDGWGHAQDPERSAIDKADTPFIDSLYSKYPNAELCTHGSEVGLPDGQMGNSEVGHLNIGAGRIVYQELARINKAVEDESLDQNEEILAMLDYAESNTGRLHILGLLSDGGVHSHINHIIALSRIAGSRNIEVYLHMFLDGRDTSPNGGRQYLERLLREKSDNSALSTVIGRYYAMDRDQRWERIQKAYDLLVAGKGILCEDVIEAVEKQYSLSVTDEFMEPLKMKSPDYGLIENGDAVLFANFRTDRPRQLTRALSQEVFPDQNMSPLNLYYVTMTEYDDSFENIHVVFRKDVLKNTLGEYISERGLKQLRIAETEKYPHVTFFFSGGREEAFKNESRILVNSPKVATYDLQPEMSAEEVTGKLLNHLLEEKPDFVVLNFANADMVGHTGVFEAAIKAAETVDSCMAKIVELAVKEEYRIIIIADHGNSDIMINPDGSPHTAHTTNPVPIIVIDPFGIVNSVKDGKLADIAPSILNLMDLSVPKEMNGDILV